MPGRHREKYQKEHPTPVAEPRGKKYGTRKEKPTPPSPLTDREGEYDK